MIGAALPRARGALLACLAAAGCSRPVATAPDRSTDAVLVVKSNVRDAQLYVDGRLVAALDRLPRGISIAPGRHRLELRRSSYFSGYQELQLARGERRQLVLELAPILP